METDKHVLYTDGHEVTVTESVLQVNRKWYNLSGITNHGFSIIPPVRLPAVLAMSLGSALVILGAARLLPAGTLFVLDVPFLVNNIALGTGILLVLFGAALLGVMGERYAVSITTAEGQKNVVISRHKEYIYQIVHALNDAFFAKVKTDKGAMPPREFKVSHR
ncbi:MAG: hypothetical protein JNK10_12160 [Cyclobacteriaceae bacterium]|nr:hypothetical protein [Cyclobacteriaceae bacterium]